MANFRKNHNKGASVGGGMITKVGIFAAIIGGLYFLFNFSASEEDSPFEDGGPVITEDKPDTPPSIDLSITDNFWPTSTTGEIIERLHYTFSYSEEHEQAEWVAYQLTKKSIQQDNVPRSGDFRPDPKVRKGSASTRDYFRSGYDRGHMAPAGDMNFDKRAMSETFYMSNMSPQIRNFNGGIWRELEETVRDWAYDNEEIYVVTGPVLTTGIRERIGDNRVSVPDMYYKVLLDVKAPGKKAIAFVMPNEVSYRPISDYAVSIDYVETLTGIDFFHQFLDEDFENELESKVDLAGWDFDTKRQELRIDSWNKRK